MRMTIKFLLVLLTLLVFSGLASAQEASVIILVSDNVADLAVANTLAEKIDVKVVVTPWGTLSDKAVQEITASGAAEVYVVGGTVAVPDVEVKVKIKVKRFAGEDRYHTSALIAGEWKNCSEVSVAVGNDDQGIMDARAIAKVKNCPIVFVRPDSMPESVAASIERLNASTAVVIPTPNMHVAEIKSKIRVRGIGEVNETPIDFEQRASNAIEYAEAAIAQAEGNTTEVIDGRTTMSARLVINAKKHLEKAKEAFNGGKYGEAFGLATAAKVQAESSVKISQGVVVGTFKQDVSGAEEEIKARGLAKIKEEIDVEAGKYGVKIAMPESIPTAPPSREGNVTERGTDAGRG
ncbi:MAG: cell wall-binding repeat-containing protein [Candidatus Hydrothermarchaeales archaeon]